MKMNETGTTIDERESPKDSSPEANCLSVRKNRNNAVDALRGLVMIIMALDHTRDYFHSAVMSFPPEDLTRTTVAVFFTRWITHICAPVFFFTTGLGAFFWLGRGHTQSLTSFLVKRGLWLVLLELPSSDSQ